MAPTPPTLGAPGEPGGAPREPIPKLLMLPPQSPKTREWAARVKAGVPGLEVVVAEDAAAARAAIADADRSEEHTSELQSLAYLVCRLLLEKKKENQLYSSRRSVPAS